jgi:hypothetical protein
MNKMLRRLLPCLVVLCTGCFFRGADDGVQPGALTPSEWAALSKPGPSHQLLDVFAGAWDVKITFWSQPNGQPQDSHGSSQLSWILGNRFLKEDFEGDVLGEQYQGLGLMGYDAASRRFTTVWIDSLNTTVAVQKGKFFPEENTFDLTGEVYDPMLGHNKTTQSQIRVNSPDSYTVTMTDKASNGKQYKSLEIQYTRKQAGKKEGSPA